MNVRKILAVLGMSVGILGAAPAAHATVDHCPDHETETKIEGGSPDHVPSARSVICVKAGTENTGVITADGVTTLRGYLKAAGIVGGDGEGRDPSYVVVYELVLHPPAEETTPTTTTIVPLVVPDPPATDTPLGESPVTEEAPHIVCPDGNGFTFKTDLPGCPPIAQPEVAGITELPRTGTSPWALALAGFVLVALGVALRFAVAKR